MRLVLALLAASAFVYAKEPQEVDTRTLDGVVSAFYTAVSGPAGRDRDWATIRTLFMPEARIISAHPDKAGRPALRSLTVPEYEAQSGPAMKRLGFFDQEMRRSTRRFGNVAQVLSSYRIRNAADGPVTVKGVNAWQLYNDGKRWWIASICFDTDRPGNPLPKELSDSRPD
jgi:hypothetical protein